MSTEVHVFSRAEKNISDAFRYYENESPGLGEIFILRFQEILQNISEHPMMYPKVTVKYAADYFIGFLLLSSTFMNKVKRLF